MEESTDGINFSSVMKRFRSRELIDFSDMIDQARFMLNRGLTDREAAEIEDLWHNKAIDKN